MMKKGVLLLVSFLFLGVTFGEISHFDVSVSQSPVKVNEAVDLTITAVNGEGDVVEGYEGDILIEAGDDEGNLVEDHVSLPNDGFYTFKPEDQGKKTFSKGLQAEESGKYTIRALEIINEDVEGENTFVVNEEGSDDVSGTIDVSSPAKGSTQQSLPVNVIAESNLPNSPVELYVDGEKKKEDITNANGGVNLYINELKDGEHKLQLKIINSTNEVVASSEEIEFTYTSPTDDFYKSLEVMPSNKVVQGDIVKFKANVSSEVSSITLTLEDVGSYPMKKEKEGVFVKEIALSKVGIFPVSLDISDGDNNKVVSDIKEIEVMEKWAVENIKYYNNEEGEIQTEWSYSGDVKKFKVKYGEEREELTNEEVVDTSSLVLPLEKGNEYFLKVIPLDAEGEKKGESSDIISIEIDQHGAPTCKVKDIEVNTEKEGDKYFLTWDEVNGANKYVVYKSGEGEELDIEEMQKVKEFTGTRFEYPFDAEAEKTKYSNYAVVAECGDGTSKKIDDIKKVKVGPEDTIIMFILLGLFGYIFYRLYSFSRD